MKKNFILLSALAFPVYATEMPPDIPSGPVSYDAVTYDDAMFGAEDPFIYQDNTPVQAPVMPSSSGGERAFIRINAYTNNYSVRGMGVTDHLASNGYSSVSGSYTLGNRNLFNMGIYQRIGAEAGVVWGATAELADTPVLHGHYALGKEIFPNLNLEWGYTLRHGGLEGYLSRFGNGAPHRLAQDFNLSLEFNDHQRGFFGGFVWGWGFQGLTGHYLDLELGYRFTDVVNTSRWGADLEVSAGWAGSFGYWGAGVEGTDATRLRIAAPIFTHSGSLGRDGKMFLTPWLQFAASGSNAGKIDRVTGYGPVDHFQFSVGLDLGWKF